MNARILILLTLFACSGQPEVYAAEASTLDQLIASAFEHRPGREVVQAQREALEGRERSLWSNLIPKLDVGAVITRGAPGGNSMFQLNGNLPASARVGQGAALVLRYTPFDFGQTHTQIAVVRAEREIVERESTVWKAEVASAVVDAYYECARGVSLGQIYIETVEELAKFEAVIRVLVGTGQRSPIDLHLARAQLAEVRSLHRESQARLPAQEHRLEILTGEHSVHCPNLATITAPNPSVAYPAPALALAHQRTEVAERRITAALWENRATLAILADGGVFSSEKLSDPWNYSVSAAVTLPLFDGLRRSGEMRRARGEHSAALAQEREQQARLDALRAFYQGQIDGLREMYGAVAHEIEEAQRGFTIAKSRYRRAQGPLADIRETLRNLLRVRVQAVDTRSRLLNAEAQRDWAGAR